ncbi:MAG TPA: ISKra4 family transposase [bacterium]|nr:ISKra4 family transposase [bacterium]
MPHGRRGKASDGIARTREAKLGAVFTQTRVDEQGHPVRDPDSTSSTGKIEEEEVERFGGRLYAEAVRRGLNEAEKVAVVGDGAPWVWNLADLHFPGAAKIVDFYHAAEHLNGIAHLLYPEDEARRKAWFGRMRKRLKRGRVLEIISELGGLKLGSKKKEALAKAVVYFEKNQERMRYDRFRKQGLFIGSGVVEAGCKSLIGKRLKQSGMHWTVRGANAIIALRCCLESGGFEDYWDARRAA